MLARADKLKLSTIYTHTFNHVIWTKKKLHGDKYMTKTSEALKNAKCETGQNKTETSLRHCTFMEDG